MKHLFLILAFLGSGLAHADLLIEPSLAVDMSNNTITPKTSGTTDLGGKATLIDPGIRLGYVSMLGLFVAGDYQMAMSGKYTPSDSTVSGAGKMSRSQVWLDVGYAAPLLFRVWAGYAVQNQMELKGDTGTIKFTGGSAVKVGAGFNLIPLLSLNIEYIMNNWTKFDADIVSGKTADYYSPSKGNSILVGVSIPLTL